MNFNWATFFSDVESFFSAIGHTFLNAIKAAIPVAEQAAINFIAALVEQIVTDVENGTIPLPALAAEGVTPDALTVGKTKRDVAYAAIQEKLATMTLPEGMVINPRTVYFTIELQVMKIRQAGNGGNGGENGNFAEKKDA